MTRTTQFSIRRITGAAALAMLLIVLAASSGRAADAVKTRATLMTGTIVSTDPLKVVFEKDGTKQIPVNEIQWIRYDQEPPLLHSARMAIDAGRYEDAIKAIDKINRSAVGEAKILGEMDFHRAEAAARLALAGDGDIQQAGGQLVEFIKHYPESHHLLDANQLVGDLLVASQNYEKAGDYYARIAKAPWPDYKLRATNALGQVHYAQGKIDAALKAFESVLDSAADSPLATRQKQLAAIGKARCMVDQEKPSDAVALIEDTLDGADPEDVPIMAQGYNALGAARRAAGKPHDAILAFLHVNILFFSARNENIEALRNLVDLWKEVGKPDRAEDAVRTLEDRYGLSP